jgi:hypothetical protein
MKLDKGKLKSVNGALQCENLDCPSFKAKKAVRSRDQLSALAIGLAGLSKILYGATFPPFDHTVSQRNTDLFKKNSKRVLAKL